MFEPVPYDLYSSKTRERMADALDAQAEELDKRFSVFIVEIVLLRAAARVLRVPK